MALIKGTGVDDLDKIIATLQVSKEVAANVAASPDVSSNVQGSVSSGTQSKYNEDVQKNLDIAANQQATNLPGYLQAIQNAGQAALRASARLDSAPITEKNDEIDANQNQIMSSFDDSIQAGLAASSAVDRRQVEGFKSREEYIDNALKDISALQSQRADSIDTLKDGDQYLAGNKRVQNPDGTVTYEKRNFLDNLVYALRGGDKAIVEAKRSVTANIMEQNSAIAGINSGVNSYYSQEQFEADQLTDPEIGLRERDRETTALLNKALKNKEFNDEDFNRLQTLYAFDQKELEYLYKNRDLLAQDAQTALNIINTSAMMSQYAQASAGYKSKQQATDALARSLFETNKAKDANYTMDQAQNEAYLFIENPNMQRELLLSGGKYTVAISHITNRQLKESGPEDIVSNLDYAFSAAGQYNTDVDAKLLRNSMDGFKSFFLQNLEPEITNAKGINLEEKRSAVYGQYGITPEMLEDSATFYTSMKNNPAMMEQYVKYKTENFNNPVTQGFTLGTVSLKGSELLKNSGMTEEEQKLVLAVIPEFETLSIDSQDDYDQFVKGLVKSAAAKIATDYDPNELAKTYALITNHADKLLRTATKFDGAHNYEVDIKDIKVGTSFGMGKNGKLNPRKFNPLDFESFKDILLEAKVKQQTYESTLRPINSDRSFGVFN